MDTSDTEHTDEPRKWFADKLSENLPEIKEPVSFPPDDALVWKNGIFKYDPEG